MHGAIITVQFLITYIGDFTDCINVLMYHLLECVCVSNMFMITMSIL